MSNRILSHSIHSPIGELTFFAEAEDAIIALEWGRGRPEEDCGKLLREAAKQLNAYFDGSLHTFDLPVQFNGTAHERSVWAAMQKIPYGKTETYGALARRLGSSARAIGGACGRNPIPIIVPCHRVMASGGGMGGYSGEGGIETKRRLLVLEGALEQEWSLI